jgi:hypothetical protein
MPVVLTLQTESLPSYEICFVLAFRSICRVEITAGGAQHDSVSHGLGANVLLGIARAAAALSQSQCEDVDSRHLPPRWYPRQGYHRTPCSGDLPALVA